MTIEDQLMDDVRNRRQVDLERALLIASGCETEEKVAEYKAKIGEIEKRLDAGAVNPLQIITNIHNLFWEMGDPCREMRTFELPDAIDAKLAEEPVGTCAILSALYVSLGLRRGLDIRGMVMPGHVALRVIDNGMPIDIDTRERFGIGWNGYSGIEGMPPPAIVASLLNNRGIAKYRLRDLKGAITDYSKALVINPKDVDALNNRGVAKYRMGNPEGAIEDYSKAREINPKYANVLYNRGYLREELGDWNGAEEDFEAYRKLIGESQ